MKKCILLVWCICIFPLYADAVRQTVSARQVEKNVSKVMKVYKWEKSIEDLQEKAEKKNKMMFWLQVVGKLDGGL